MTYRIDALAIPLRPVIRLLVGALLASAAFIGSAFPVHAAPAAGGSRPATYCPVHASAHHNSPWSAGDQGQEGGTCGTSTHACVPATVPPLPPVLTPPPPSSVPPWLTVPEAPRFDEASAAADGGPDLTALCVSRT